MISERKQGVFWKAEDLKILKQPLNSSLNSVQVNVGHPVVTFQLINNYISFYAIDNAGQEFLFKEVKNFLLKKNALIHPKGTPGISKLGNIERAIRTIRSFIRSELYNLKTPAQYLKYFRYCVKLYNKNIYGHSSLKGKSPEQFLKTGVKYPWSEQIDGRSFDYKKLTKLIDDKIKKVEQLYPFNSAVRLNVPRSTNVLKKKTDYSTWSSSIYFIRGYKRPVSIQKMLMFPFIQFLILAWT